MDAWFFKLFADDVIFQMGETHFATGHGDIVSFEEEEFDVFDALHRVVIDHSTENPCVVGIQVECELGVVVSRGRLFGNGVCHRMELGDIGFIGDPCLVFYSLGGGVFPEQGVVIAVPVGV